MAAAKDTLNILMVDDQPAKLATYEAILSDLGENLVKANSGKQALEILLKTDIAVVLMDVNMPEIDGFEMAEIIHQHPRFQKTAIIFISAVHLTDLDQIKGYQRGAVDYISVPVIPELLRAKVSVFCQLHRQSQQLEFLNRELRRLSVSLLTTQDDERRRVARDLHDGLGQDLTAAKIMLQGTLRNGYASKGDQGVLKDAVSLIESSLQQIRSVSYLLHPPLLDEVGLRSAIAWYLDGLTKRSDITTTMSVEPADFPRLSPEVETALFRIVQEALTNVYRHSKARAAHVSLAKKEKEVVATITDNGVGVVEEVSAFRPDRIGVGISSMKQRATQLGGELRLKRGSPGMIVEAVIPLVPAAERVPVAASAT